ncbi:unnamed protein product [Protopolystoma xenopodis]|uniref:Uncharacterized protein n=1 Tax=Protopolystoma xenopodis TaxID=117903 RepID=A0A3S5BSN6_9PLAT|nr:unnamed protein product [Protopolystoma xenopodis]
MLTELEFHCPHTADLLGLLKQLGLSPPSGQTTTAPSSLQEDPVPRIYKKEDYWLNLKPLVSPRMSPSSDDVRPGTNESSSRLRPKRWRMSRGLHQAERRDKAKWLEYNANGTYFHTK